MKIIKTIFFVVIILLNNFNYTYAENFESWVISFKDYAIKMAFLKKQ